MGKLIDLTGKKFGRLTVIKRTGSNEGKRIIYLCKCECGKEKIIRGDNLRNGKTKSCGCLHNELAGGQNRLNPGVARMRALISIYKKRAKRQGLEWELTEKQFARTTKKDCFYCGAKPNNTSKHPECNGNYIYNGIDRVDNKKGYTLKNIVPCCKECNSAKKNFTLQEFKDWIKKIYIKCFKEELVNVI